MGAIMSILSKEMFYNAQNLEAGGPKQTHFYIKMYENKRQNRYHRLLFSDAFLLQIISLFHTTYIKQMQNTDQTSTKSIRLGNMNSLRASMKKISIISQKTIDLESKLRQMKASSIKEIEKEHTTEDCSSVDQASLQEVEPSPLNSFLEQYQILEKLGEGANGCVYKCMHKTSQKLYAFKKIKAEQEHVSELKENFEILRKINHPSIIKYHAHCFDQKKHCSYLIMELFEGPTLSDLKIKDEQQMRFIAKQLIKALRYLHSRNVCHRDIKPENILYSRKDKIVKIIDFGICKKTFQRGSRRDMLTIIGTPFYIAPQVYIGGGYDEHIDNWALGITLYKLVTGNTPFEDVYHSDTITNIIKAEPSFQQEQWNNYSSQLKNFVSRLIQKKEQRMSLRKASKHLWLQEQKPRLRKSLSEKKDKTQESHEQSNKLKNDPITPKVRMNSSTFELTDQWSQCYANHRKWASSLNRVNQPTLSNEFFNDNI